ncbi:MAG: hypothetical protein KDB14_35200 [Planctomycetales bacterium]|nr:hypothetical protein [Planctomycetales bacterium]
MATMLHPFIRERQADEYILYSVDVNPILKITPAQLRRMRDAGYLLKMDQPTGTRYIMPDAARLHLKRKVWKCRRKDNGGQHYMQMPAGFKQIVKMIT